MGMNLATQEKKLVYYSGYAPRWKSEFGQWNPQTLSAAA